MALIRQANAKDVVRDAIVLDLGDVQRQAAMIMARARRQADESIAGAKEERERILEGAEEAGRAAGYARGLEEGRKAGREQGESGALSEWRPKLEQTEKRWGEALASFEGERDRMLTEARVDVLRLAVALAEKVVKRVVQVDAGVVGAQLEAVLALVARPTDLVVSVHPEDRAGAETALPSLLARFQSVRHVELLEDGELTRGSCVARTRGAAGAASGGGGEINASVDEQLARIADLLLPDHQEGGAR